MQALKETAQQAAATAQPSAPAGFLQLFPKLLEFVIPHVLVLKQVDSGVPVPLLKVSAGAATCETISRLQLQATSLVHQVPDCCYQPLLPLLCFFLRLCKGHCRHKHLSEQRIVMGTVCRLSDVQPSPSLFLLLRGMVLV